VLIISLFIFSVYPGFGEDKPGTADAEVDSKVTADEPDADNEVFDDKTKPPADKSAPDEKRYVMIVSLVDFSFGFAIGGLVGGLQKEAAAAVSPAAGYHQAFLMNLSASVYPVRYAGLELGYTFWGDVTAMNFFGSADKNIYDNRYLQGGLSLRYPIKINNSYLAVFGGGGVTYNFLDLAAEYKKFTQTFYDRQPDWGWYAKAGTNVYIDHIFFGIALQYNLSRVKLDIASTDYDGSYLQGQLYLGVCF
jgi:hypothetical protein